MNRRALQELKAHEANRAYGGGPKPLRYGGQKFIGDPRAYAKK